MTFNMFGDEEIERFVCLMILEIGFLRKGELEGRVIRILGLKLGEE